MPDIPAVTTDYGPQQNAINLGNSLDNLTNVLAKRYYAQQQNDQQAQAGAVKAYQDAEVALETLNAQNYIDDQFNQFNNDLKGNPNHDQFGTLLQQKSDEVWQGAQQFLKLPEAQTAVEKYFGQVRSNASQATYTLARDKLVGNVEQVGYQTLNDAIAKGDVQKVADTRDVLLSHGVLSPQQADKVTNEDIPKTKYNNILGKLVPSGQAGIDLLESPNAVADIQKQFGIDLSQDQVDTMDKFLTERQTRQEAVAKKQADLANSKLELSMSDMLAQYMEKGLEGAGVQSWDQLIAKVDGQPWQGQDASAKQTYWLKQFDSASNGTSIHSDPMAENELWKLAIGEHAGWTPDDRQKAMFATGYLGTKVDGKLFNEILSATQDIPRNGEWDSYLKSITESYNAILQGMASTDKNQAAIQKTAYQSGIAYRAMLATLRNNPHNPTVWQKKLDELKAGNVVEAVHQAVTDYFSVPGQPPAKLPGWWQYFTGRGVTKEMEMEINRQASAETASGTNAPDAFSQDPLIYPAWKEALPNLQEQMRSKLPPSARDATIQMQGDSTYFSKGDSLYFLKAESINGTINLVPYKAVKNKDGSWGAWVKQ